MEFAQNVAREAGALIRDRWDDPRVVRKKRSAIDLVTDCDRAAEDLIVGQISRAYPEHAILAEEGAGNGLVDRGYCWIVDPLDGTVNWVHGCPHVAVSIALAYHGRVETGVVYDPLRNELFCSARTKGAWRNGWPISTSTTSELGNALLATGFPYDCRERAGFYVSFFEAFMKASRGLRRFGSAALDLCYVACGRFDGFWEWELKPWDTAAGALIVAEAGGQVTDFSGAPASLSSGQTLASNGQLHGQMRAVIERSLPTVLHR